MRFRNPQHLPSFAIAVIVQQTENQNIRTHPHRDVSGKRRKMDFFFHGEISEREQTT